MSEKKITKTGRFGHYHVTKDFAKMNTGLQARFFTKPALNDLLQRSYYCQNIRARDYKNAGIDDEEKKKYYETFFMDSDEEFIKENTIFNTLFDLFDDLKAINYESLSVYQKAVKKRKELLLNFSLKVGLFVTFVMIQATNPVDEDENTDESEEVTNSKKKKSQLSIDWIKNSVDLISLWNAFKEIARYADMTRSTNKTYEDYQKNRISETSNAVQPSWDKIYVKDRLSQTFEAMWPYTFKTLLHARENSRGQIQEFYNKTPKGFDNYEKKMNESLDSLKKKMGDKQQQSSTKKTDKV